MDCFTNCSHIMTSTSFGTELIMKCTLAFGIDHCFSLQSSLHLSICIGSVVGASAGTTTGNDLWESCKTDTDYS
jgi:hypothetical protein